MKTTKELITECFKKAKMEKVPTDRTKYLFQLLCDEFDSHFRKLKNKWHEDTLRDTVMEGYNISMGDYTIEASNGDGGRDLRLIHYYEKPRYYNTVKGAMNFIENN